MVQLKQFFSGAIVPKLALGILTFFGMPIKYSVYLILFGCIIWFSHHTMAGHEEQSIENWRHQGRRLANDDKIAATVYISRTQGVD